MRYEKSATITTKHTVELTHEDVEAIIAKWAMREYPDMERVRVDINYERIDHVLITSEVSHVPES